MGFSVGVEKLLNGDISFLVRMNQREMEDLIVEVRAYQEIKDKVIERCKIKLVGENPLCAFLLLYDMEEYRYFSEAFLRNHLDILEDYNFLYRFLRCSWGEEFAKKNLKLLADSYYLMIYMILNFCVHEGKENLLKELLYSKDFKIRGKAMYELMCNFPYLFLKYYPNPIEAMAEKDSNGNVTNIIDGDIASQIAYMALDNSMGHDLFNELKEFIFKNYDYNILASLLAGERREVGDLGIAYLDELKSDMTRFFLTSKDYKYELFKIGENSIDRDVYLDFKRRISPFLEIDEEMMEHIFLVGLGNQFLEFVDKYLEKSTGAKVVTDLGRGSCTRTIRIGDYVIKCSERKWDLKINYPQLFMFAKEYEFILAVDNWGDITGALEVQKYYTKPVLKDETKVIKAFFERAREYGYEIKDDAIGLNDKPNLFRLDSYKDAVYEDESSLPEWFKEEPVVWVDIDMIHKIK